MPLPSLVDVAELEARLGQAITDDRERERAAKLLSDASTLVRHEASATWVDADGNLDAVPDIAFTLTVHAALRGWYNPAGVESTQLGAASVRYNNVWLTSAERAQISGLTSMGGMFNIELRHGYGFGPDSEDYVPVDYGGGVGFGTGDWSPLGQ